MSKYGPIKTPPKPNKKRKLGPLDIKPGKGAPREGQQGQPRNSWAYVPNKNRKYESGKDKPSGYGGSD